MLLKHDIVGKHILMRSALKTDAKFILKLRLDPRLNKFLHETDPSLEKQKRWIIEKQKAIDDYHMIIQSLEGKRLGVVALYDIDWKKKTFDWGRWVISKDAPIYTAGESVILIYHFAFNDLKLKMALLTINKKNKVVVNFHKNYGAKVTKIDNMNVYFRFSEKDFDRFLKKYHIALSN